MPEINLKIEEVFGVRTEKLPLDFEFLKDVNLNLGEIIEGKACQENSSYFEVGGDEFTAKALCKVCPIRRECLYSAILNRFKHDIWGGLNGEERSQFSSAVRSCLSGELELIPN